MRLLAQQARFQEALAIEVPVRSPLRRPGAEVVLSRALVLASAGRTTDARSLVDEVCGLSHAVEPAVLAPAVEAICALSGAAPMQSNGWWSSSTLPSEPVPSTFW